VRQDYQRPHLKRRMDAQLQRAREINLQQAQRGQAPAVDAQPQLTVLGPAREAGRVQHNAQLGEHGQRNNTHVA